jgi:STAM-binding protein
MSSQRRPRTIAELAAIALSDIHNEPVFKQYLRKAEKEWKDGKKLVDEGDLEHAYIALVKAAKIILEKMVEHPEYNRELNPQQQANLGEVRAFVFQFLQAPFKSTIR